MQNSQKILVVGATGGTGRATVEQLVRAGHQVSAFSRNADKLAEISDAVTTINGDVTNVSDIENAMPGHDAVIVTLGITENPLRVRLFGAAKTAMDVRSQGTRNVIAAMNKHGVRRLVVLSSYGVGKTSGRLRFMDQLVFNLLLKPQIADTQRQEDVVRSSNLDWVIGQPVHLTNDEDKGEPFVSESGKVQGWKVARQSVAKFLAAAVLIPSKGGKSFALSGATG